MPGLSVSISEVVVGPQQVPRSQPNTNIWGPKNGPWSVFWGHLGLLGSGRVLASGWNAMTGFSGGKKRSIGPKTVHYLVYSIDAKGHALVRRR
jgi:hypothetical protein